jgi:hypothetical protein
MANKLVDFVLEYTDQWRENRDVNYLENWKEFERLWRGEWASEDRLRDSERSRITSPALQQAIENHALEIEDAVYGQGEHLFEIEDDMKDEDSSDVAYIQEYMKECFKKTKLRKAVGDVVLLASIYGTGIGEVVVKEMEELTPATRPLEGMDAMAVGVESKKKVMVMLKPISPQNFLIDPNATSIEEAMGCAVEEFVSAHLVAENIKKGIYKDDKDIGDDASPETNLEPSWIDQQYDDDKIKIIRYYGLVPRNLLEASEDEVVELFGEKDDDISELMEEYGDMVEAIVVIGNDKLLKAEKSPYMMKDRPIVHYQDDTVPNRFWGRGVAEKGYNMQKAIDAQLRAHLDSLALTTAPMMAMDATRLPRGAKFEIRPGKTILTNGNPNEILTPFKFGNTDPANIETASRFEGMLAQATGTVDPAALQTPSVGGGELSVSLSSVIKKNKRTLVNFQDQFLIPFIEKAAWRFMQFDPENFPAQDFKFIPISSLGMLAREVEQMQFINLMKTLGPDSPVMPILMTGVIQNSSLSNKSALLAQLQQGSEPDPQQQQLQQMQIQMEMQSAQAEIAKTTSEAKVNEAKAMREMTEAEKNRMEAAVLPDVTKAKLVSALSNNLQNDNEQADFDKRVKLADLMLREKELDQNLKVVEMQMKEKQGQNGEDFLKKLNSELNGTDDGA